MGRVRAPLHIHLVLLLALVCAASPAVARGPSAAAPSAIHLEADGFEAALATIDPRTHALVELYMPWCPACQNFRPSYDRVAAFFNGDAKATGKKKKKRPEPTVTVFSVDCQKNGHLCDDFDVRGYPTVLFGTVDALKNRRRADGKGKGKGKGGEKRTGGGKEGEGDGGGEGDDDEVLKERRSPRERGRMGTSHDDDAAGEGMEELKISPRTAERVVELVGERTGVAAGTHVLQKPPDAKKKTREGASGGGGMFGGMFGSKEKKKPPAAPSSSS